MKRSLGQFKKNLLLLSIVSAFSACGIIPLAENQSSEDDIFFEEKISTETTIPSNTLVESPEVTAQISEEPQKNHVTFSNARGYWLAAIEYLQNGEEKDAEWALEQALILKPGSKISKNLLSQIESDAVEVLGEEHFEYTIQNGDSLSKLAKQYLNDPMQFYILAKYNQITHPGHLVIDENIKIPGKKPIQLEQIITVDTTGINSIPVLNATTEDLQLVKPITTSSILMDATELFQSEEYGDVIFLLEDNDELENSDVEAKKLLIDSYYLKAQKLLETQAKLDAKVLLLKASKLEPDNVKINMALIDLDESDEAQKMTEQSAIALAANSPIEAYELINRALAIQSNFSPALEKKKEIKQQLVSYYYKHALMAQRRQELDKAVDYWDEVLALDEGNDNAKLYRAKSIALKSKMEKFVSVY